MTKTIALLAASTALAAVIGLPALSETQSFQIGDDTAKAASFREDAAHGYLVKASYDDDDDDGRHDDRDDRDDRDDDCDEYDDDDDHDKDDDHYDCADSVRKADPAGTVTPPKGDVLDNGAAPIVPTE